MKNMLFVALLIPSLAFAQVKHDNTISIHGGTIKQAVNAFMDAGFQIDKYDTTMGFVYTAETRLNKTASVVIYSARIKDSVLILTGKFRSTVSFSKILLNDKENAIDDSKDYMSVELRGMNGSDFMITWNQMDKIAKSFGLPISYTKN